MVSGSGPRKILDFREGGRYVHDCSFIPTREVIALWMVLKGIFFFCMPLKKCLVWGLEKTKTAWNCRAVETPD